MFIAFGQQGLRMASADGRNWSQPIVSKENYYFKGVEYAQGNYVAFATLGGKVAFFSSADGRGWEKTSELEVAREGGRLHDIAYGNDRFLVIGGNMDGHWTSVMTSEDGKNWSGPKKFDKQPLLTRVAFGGGQFVAVGIKGRVATSQDGQSWKDAEPLQPLDTLIDLCFGNGVYVGTGLHGLRMWSTDGLNWQGRQTSEEGEHINSILWTGDRFVGVGLGASFFSEDGRRWKRKANSNPPVTCTFGSGLFVGSRWRGRVLISEDAIAWQEALRAPEHVNGVSFGGQTMSSR